MSGDTAYDLEGLRKFLRKPRTAVQVMMDAWPRPPMPPHYANWSYYDLPGWVTTEQWNAFGAIIGVENIRLLSGSSRDGFERGQFFISPDGMRRLASFIGNA